MSLIAYTNEKSIRDEKDLVNLLNKRFEIAKRYRSAFDEKFDRMYQYYRSYIEYDPEYWYRYQLFLPYIFSIIESITPDFIEALIGSDDFFSCKATGLEKPRAENMKTLMGYQLDEKMAFYTKILMWVKSMLTFGTGIMNVGWRKETKEWVQKEWIQDPLLGLAGSVDVKRVEDIINDPMIETVFIKNFYPQPHKESVKDCGWCFERAFVDWDYIQSLKSKGLEEKGVYKNLEEIKKTRPPSEYKQVMEEMNTLVGIATSTQEDPINKPVELLKYWKKDRVILEANRKVIIRDTGNPFQHCEIPYIDAKNYPLEKEFYGISDVELLIPLQDIINDITNLRLDNLIDLVNTSYIAKKHSGINADEIQSGPSRVIWSDDVGAIVPLQKPAVQAGTEKEVEGIYKVMQRVSGAWEYYQGATPERKETATGIVRLQEAALRRFGYRIKMLQKTKFKEILTQIMQLNQQLLPMDYTIKVFEEDKEIKLNPWDIAGKFVIQISGSSHLVGLEDRMLKMWSEVRDDPYFDQLELRKRLLDILDIPNSEDLLKTSEGLLGMAQQGAPGGAPGAGPGGPGGPGGVEQLVQVLQGG